MNPTMEMNAHQVRRRVGWLPRGAKLVFVREPQLYGWMNRWFASILFDEGQFITIPVLNQVFLTSTPGPPTQTYTSDSTWNNSNNTVECVGAGASGGAVRASANNVATGGGAGAYSLITNFNFATPGTTTATYELGLGGAAITQSASGSTAGNNGGATWFNSATDPGNGADNTKCSAQGGFAGAVGANPQNGGAGGAATSSWGQTKNAGGRGGNSGSFTSVATGGAGAGGPDGAGNQGVDGTGTQSATNGGTSDAGSDAGGTAGAGANGSGAQTGGNGGNGTKFDSSHGLGGGGGGARSTSNNVTGTGGSGGNYGGGGGGAIVTSPTGTTAVSGAGIQGLIVLTWTPAAGSFDWFKSFEIRPSRTIIRGY